MQTRAASASSFDSPFKGGPDSTKIPSFAAYRNKGGETGPKVFQYFMVGTMGALTALGAKNTVQGRSTTHHNGEAELWKRRESRAAAVGKLWEINWRFYG